jgi:hypothetical protein
VGARLSPENASANHNACAEFAIRAARDVGYLAIIGISVCQYGREKNTVRPMNLNATLPATTAR